jgi:hypothetical protein
MIYVLAALLPPVGLLLNGQPFSALFNVVLIVFCAIFGLIFHVLLLGPSAHAAGEVLLACGHKHSVLNVSRLC